MMKAVVLHKLSVTVTKKESIGIKNKEKVKKLSTY
jgi:hypothetical protein